MQQAANESTEDLMNSGPPCSEMNGQIFQKIISGLIKTIQTFDYNEIPNVVTGCTLQWLIFLKLYIGESSDPIDLPVMHLF